MSAYKCSRHELELTSFRLAGLAQALHAFSVSDCFKNQADALELLHEVAQEAVNYIAAHVEASPTRSARGRQYSRAG